MTAIFFNTSRRDSGRTRFFRNSGRDLQAGLTRYFDFYTTKDLKDQRAHFGGDAVAIIDDEKGAPILEQNQDFDPSRYTRQRCCSSAGRS